uniref:J domain-containing protein n=1 Tax=Alexandrium monilatum TaxID=311494 RepID=A0A7S4VZG6_9DINO
MVASGGKDDDLGDPYELLGIAEEAGDKEVQAAYRKGSLKCHPDRNPDDAEAAQKFDRLTRAKDLLLNPVERAAVDRQRKTKRDLEERFAQEDAKRRKLREDLEGREEAAARGANAAAARESAQDARRRFVQADTAARIKEREAKLAERQAEVVAEAVEARQSAVEAQLQVRWRDPAAAAGPAAVREALAGFHIRSIELTESGALVQMGSREDALRAVLQCRERKHQLPFRVALASAARRSPARGAPVRQDSGLSSEREEPAAPQAPAGSPCKPARTPSFDDWEASMLSSLQGLAQAQRKARAQA